jgi:hypothetical protein
VEAVADAIILQQLVQPLEVADKVVELTTQQLLAEQIQAVEAVVQDTVRTGQ